MEFTFPGTPVEWEAGFEHSTLFQGFQYSPWPVRSVFVNEVHLMNSQNNIRASKVD